MLKRIMKELGVMAICVIVCLFFPKIVKAGETVTGGERWSLAVDVELEKEYTTTTAEGWVKLHVPANTVCIGAGFDKYTQIEGYYEINGSIKVLDKELQGHGYGSNENQVKLGQQTFFWDFHIEGNNDYYFFINSEKTDVCTFRFICETKDVSGNKRMIELNKYYTDSYYIYNGSANKFVAPSTGKYRIITDCINGTAKCRLTYKDGTDVQELFDDNNLNSNLYYLEQGMTYHLYVSANPEYGSTSKVIASFLVSNTRVSSITLNENNLTLNKGGQVLLTASVSPDLAVDKTVTYTSSNPSVAIVSEEGLVTALMGGTAMISATANDGSGIQAFCQVSVLPTYVTRLELDKQSKTWDIAELEENSWDDEYDGCKITATVFPKDADNCSVTFTSSNQAVISVEPATGKLTPYKAGTAIITCRTNDGSNLTQSCTVILTESHFAGEKKTINKLKYKVTSDSYGGGTVAVYGVSNKNQSVYKVPNTVKIDGYSYKVTEIGKRTFANLKKMNKITVGTNVKTIGNEAFYNSKKLKTITIQTKKLNKVGKNALKNIHAKAVIKVPSSKLSKYKKLFRNKGQKSTVKIKKG